MIFYSFFSPVSTDFFHLSRSWYTVPHDLGAPVIGTIQIEKNVFAY